MAESPRSRVAFQPIPSFPERLRLAMARPTSLEMTRKLERIRFGNSSPTGGAPRFTYTRGASSKPSTHRDHPLKVLYDPDASVDTFVQACIRWPSAHLRHLFREIGSEFKRIMFQLHAIDAFRSKGDFSAIVSGVKQSVHDQVHCERVSLLLYDPSNHSLYDPVKPMVRAPLAETLFDSAIKDNCPIQLSDIGTLKEEEEILLGPRVYSLLLMPVAHATDQSKGAGVLAAINRYGLLSFQPKDIKALSAITDCLIGVVHSYLQSRRAASIRNTILDTLRVSSEHVLVRIYYDKLRHGAKLKVRRRQAFESCCNLARQRDMALLQVYFETLGQLLEREWKASRFAKPWAATLLLCPLNDLPSMVETIAQQAKQICGADRSILFLLDHVRQEIWSQVPEGGPEIRIPLGKGIAGAVASSGTAINIQDAYNDPRFNVIVDSKTGYLTKHILCVPLLGEAGEVAGVVQLINKLSGFPFSMQDVHRVELMGRHAVEVLQRAQRHRAMEEERQRIAFLTSSLSPLLLGLDLDGKPWFCSRSPEMLEVLWEDLRQKNYIDWYPSGTNTQYIECIKQCSASGQMSQFQNFPLILHSGTCAPMDFCVAPILDEKQVRQGVVISLERRTEKQMLLATVGRYFNVEETQQLTARGAKALQPQQQQATLLCISFRFFNGPSDSTAPSRLADALDFAMNCLLEVVTEHRGVVTNCSPDYSLCAFGFPMTEASDTIRAFKVALTLRDKLSQYKEAKLAPIMALHCGSTMAVFAGTLLRKEYVLLGRATRLMVQLQRWASLYQVDIVCTSASEQASKGTTQTREIDKITYQGQELVLYEVIQTSTLAIPRAIIVMHRWYAQGLGLYREGQWAAAIVKFQAAADAGDRTAPIMIKRCNYFGTHPPPPNWSGAWDFSGRS